MGSQTLFPVDSYGVCSQTGLWGTGLWVRPCFLGKRNQQELTHELDVIEKNVIHFQDEDKSKKQDGTKPMSAHLECLLFARLTKI